SWGLVGLGPVPSPEALVISMLIAGYCLRTIGVVCLRRSTIARMFVNTVCSRNAYQLRLHPVGVPGSKAFRTWRSFTRGRKPPSEVFASHLRTSNALRRYAAHRAPALAR